MMRRFVPPPIQAFDPSAGATDPDAFGPVRDAAYEVGYEAGHRAGHAAGLADGEAQALAANGREVARLQTMLDEQKACNSVADALAQLLAARDADRQQLERQTRTAVAAALDVLFPPLMSLTIGAELVALIDQALTARTSEEITVRVSAETIAAISACGIPDCGATRVTLLPTADQPRGVAEIAWSGGGLTFDPAALLHKVTALISPSLMRKDKIECQK
jgi:hypothetical protein